MSSNSNMKPWCKVCKDAGKTEVGQWPKDKAGVTICPTLLSQNCRYCLKAGHTVKYCQVLSDKKKQDDKRMKKSARQAKQCDATQAEAKTKKAPVNVFTSLEEDSSDDEVDVKEEIKVTPKVSHTNMREIKDKKPTFLEIASRVKEEPKVEQVEVKALLEGYEVLVTGPQIGKREARAKHNRDCFQRKNGLSWADAIDSDDDDE
jgi:hypothetical protein